MNLLTAHALTKHYGKPDARPTLDNINLTLNSGETVALLGRSGCGKSTLARLLVGLEQPTSGEASYRGQPVATLDRGQLNAFRRDIQLVFQDAFSAVNPRMRIRDIIAEPLRHLTQAGRDTCSARAADMLEAVGLSAQMLSLRPAQLSGGQLQRVCLARALIVEPQLIILDEAVSSLDVVVQAQTLSLLRDLQKRLGTAFVLITHDLRLVTGFCQRVIVMDEGQIVENTAINGELQLQSLAGQALQRAILPPFPRKRLPGAAG